MKKRRPSPLLRGGLMMLSIGAVTLLWPRLEPAAVALLQKAALFTTVLDMPAGALETLRERYAAELEPAPLPEEPSEPAAEPDPQEPEIPAEIPEVPEEYRGTVTELTMTGEDSPAYVRWDNIWIRNYTKLTAAEVQKVLATPNRVTLNPKEKGPQLLLFHTHATESYELYDSPYFDTRNTWRDTDNQNNMVAVGDVLASGLEPVSYTHLDVYKRQG